MPCTQKIVPFLCARTILLLTCFCLHWTERCMNCQEGCRWYTPRLTGSRIIILDYPDWCTSIKDKIQGPQGSLTLLLTSDVSTHESPHWHAMNVSLIAITTQNNTKLYAGQLSWEDRRNEPSSTVLLYIYIIYICIRGLSGLFLYSFSNHKSKLKSLQSHKGILTQNYTGRRNFADATEEISRLTFMKQLCRIVSDCWLLGILLIIPQGRRDRVRLGMMLTTSFTTSLLTFTYMTQISIQNHMSLLIVRYSTHHSGTFLRQARLYNVKWCAVLLTI